MKLNACFRKSVLALALTGLCGVASASVGWPFVSGGSQSFILGTLDDFYLWGVWHTGINGEAIDTISFSLAKAANLSFSYGSMFSSGMSDITSASIALDETVRTSLTGLNQPDFYGSELQLVAGDYNLTISNVGALKFGGSYQFQMAVSPVPEPGSWALMLGGLGLVGALARRRTAS